MDNTSKGVLVEKQTPEQGELDIINRYALRELGADEVFTFRLAACDNQIDRDDERFSDRALEELAALYPGKPVLLDHNWSAKDQSARVYAASVEADPVRAGLRRLMLKCYIPRLDSTRRSIDAIETGLRRECSVGCMVSRHLCSICGNDYWEQCLHVRGQEYDGQRCHVVLDGVSDAYEVSLVAVPAQREAGVVKSHPAQGKAADWVKVARRSLELERVRFGALRR